jgi:Holliday junction resolvasome RuvABC endonuclease subunit
MNQYRSLLAVDPSLTCSGWALFTVRNGAVTAVGKIKSDPPAVPMSERLKSLQERIETVFSRLALGSDDILVCEAPTTVKDPHNALKVENVRSIFEAVARARAVTVPGRINPRSVHFEVMGLTGKQLPRQEVKAMALRTAEYLYQPELTKLGFAGEDLKGHQDIVDALLIGRLALTRVQSAHDGGFPLEAVFQGAVQQRRTSWRVKASGT